MKKTFIRCVLFTLVFALPGVSLGQSVKIGFVTTLTTGAAVIGKDMRDAVNLAVEDLDGTEYRGYKLRFEPGNQSAKTKVFINNLPEDAQATVTVSDVTGRVITIIRQDGAAGYNTIAVTRDMLNGATGVMSYTVTAGDYTATKKMVVAE